MDTFWRRLHVWQADANAMCPQCERARDDLTRHRRAHTHAIAIASASEPRHSARVTIPLRALSSPVPMTTILQTQHRHRRCTNLPKRCWRKPCMPQLPATDACEPAMTLCMCFKAPKYARFSFFLTARSSGPQIWQNWQLMPLPHPFVW